MASFPTPPSQQADSVSNTIINFLTAVGAVFNGVREILPFVRYIGQYLDFEFDAIKGQDQGQGVVCAATWCVHSAFSKTSFHS